MDSPTIRYSATTCEGPKEPITLRSLLNMTRKRVEGYADDITPQAVKVKDKWDLLIWMFGQYGPWIFFGFATWFLYQDNKVMQGQILEVTKSQIMVNAQVVTGLAEVRADFKTSLVEMNKQLTVIADEAKRAHHAFEYPKSSQP